MFLSRLILNAKHPQARSEVDHPYELHRTLCKAFDNPDEARILFRADADRPGEVHVLIQSLVAPDWGRIQFDPKYLKDTDEPKKVELGALHAGMHLQFRLRCRPSKRIGERGHDERGKRKPLRDKEEIFAWLRRKGSQNGFRIAEREQEKDEDGPALWVAFDRVYWFESKGGKDERPLGAVQFDGVLVVSDPDKLREAVRNGIGPQKAYGFGLLSLAPVQ